MNALKAHKKYIERIEEQKYYEERKKEMERIRDMTPKERERYMEEQKTKRQKLSEILSVPLCISHSPYTFNKGVESGK